VGCVQVGEAAVTTKDVAQATAVKDQAGKWVVDFVLTTAGSDHLNRLAASQIGKMVAIEADGAVLNLFTVQTAQFQGRGQITGLDQGTANRIAGELK
jgi:preprotein translocase subunit SecD